VFFEYHRGGGGGGMAAESFSYSPSQQVFLVMIAARQPQIFSPYGHLCFL
jgi:hypothetical protein